MLLGVGMVDHPYTWQHFNVSLSSYSLLPSANKILQEAGCAAVFPDNPPLSQKMIICEFQKAQVALVVLNATSKQHQGKFMSDMQYPAALNVILVCPVADQRPSEEYYQSLAAQDDCIAQACSKQTACVMQAIHTAVSVVRVRKP